MTMALAAIKSCESFNLRCQTELDFFFHSKILGYFIFVSLKKNIKNKGTKTSLSGYK